MQKDRECVIPFMLLLAYATGPWAPFGTGAGAVRVLGAGPKAGPAGSITSTPASGPVSASRFVLAGQPVVLECLFSLGADETLAGVTWSRDSHLVYRWRRGLPETQAATALGVLENATSPAPPGWNIYIARTTTAMAGNYTCSVHTDRGSASSRRFQLVVLLVCKARIETEDSAEVNCTVGWRVSCARVSPELNLTAGIFLPGESKFFDRIAEWTKVVYSDNTFGYHAFKRYNVADIPKSSIFLWSLSYNDQISLVTGNFSFGAVHRSGCPEPPAAAEGSGMQVQVQGALTTCRGELVSQQQPSEQPRPQAARAQDAHPHAYHAHPKAPVRGTRETGEWAAQAPRALYTCANEVQREENVQAKVLVCEGGEWVDENPGSPWPQC